MKIVLIGNCQVRLLAKMLEILCESCEVHYIVAHAENENELAGHKLVDTSDVIITQPILNEKLFPEYLLLSSIFEKYRKTKNIVTIPNLFFSGFHPDLIPRNYNSFANAPLENYHSKIIYRSWKNGNSKIDAIRFYKDSSYWMFAYKDVFNESMRELERRERDLDIKMSGFILNNISSFPLFYTFNHPTNRLLLNLCVRILKHLSIHFDHKKHWEQCITIKPLDAIKVPLSDFTRSYCGILYPTEERFFNNGRSFDVEAIVSSFYSFYDEHKPCLNA